jgi:hypothetical protein
MLVAASSARATLEKDFIVRMGGKRWYEWISRARWAGNKRQGWRRKQSTPGLGTGLL